MKETLRKISQIRINYEYLILFKENDFDNSNICIDWV